MPSITVKGKDFESKVTANTELGVRELSLKIIEVAMTHRLYPITITRSDK